jgi:EamA domain-containing membrane protein RarD
VLVVIFVFWLADTRSGLLRQHGSPLLALLVDAGVVAVVALAVVLRRTRR